MLRFGCSLRLFLILLLASAAVAVPAHAQQAPMPAPQQPNGPPNGPPSLAPPADKSEQQMLLKMARERNVDRQKEIVDDTDQLLSLAKKLKAEVDKSNKDQLSLSVVDTASKIEKLAKAVKERMRNGT